MELAFVKKVIAGIRDETCVGCNKGIGLRSYEPDSAWEFKGKLCNPCYQSVIKAIEEYDGTYVEGTFPQNGVDGSLYFQLFDHKNTTVFKPKSNQNYTGK